LLRSLFLAITNNAPRFFADLYDIIFHDEAFSGSLARIVHRQTAEVDVKVKFTLEQATKAQIGGGGRRGIALLFL
jgi:hypothetical protein